MTVRLLTTQVEMDGVTYREGDVLSVPPALGRFLIQHGDAEAVIETAALESTRRGAEPSRIFRKAVCNG